MASRTRFIEHQGRRIVLMDFSHVNDTEQAARVIDEARKFVAAQPREKSLLILVDATGSITSAPTIERLKALVAHNTPYVLASACVGVNSLLRLMMRIVTLFSGRKLATFLRADDAKDWLVAQTVPPTSVPEQLSDAG